jgi:ADP-ribosyl-[dinitrogen reductase] hydrolase
MVLYRDPELIARARGVLIGLAAGDALGAGYEFGPALSPATSVDMIGGGPFNFEPGEWTDDTSMAIVLAEELSRGNDVRDRDVQDRIVARWTTWAATANDVGNQVRAVLSSGNGTRDGAVLSAALYTTTHAHAAGNGSLMRTAPLALGYLDDRNALAEAARAISELTHPDPDAADACVIWCELIRAAVIGNGTGDTFGAFFALPADRQDLWKARIEEAEAAEPEAFPNNGWVVHALQAAWSAISHGGESLPEILTRAVRAGNDADTVAAIAGGLAGARADNAIPTAWYDALHGWPGLVAADLEALADGIVYRGASADAIEQARVAQLQYCPICGREVHYTPRYPDYVCRECIADATTLDGRPGEFFNTEFFGHGVQFVLDDSDETIGERELVSMGANCLIHGVECYAAEAHFGGIVIRPFHAKE